MDDNYNPKKFQERWSKFWTEKKLYEFKSDKNKKLFSIDTPPPTVSGELHMGHVYGYIPHDFIARFKRMQGFNVLYAFGFDDNGIATEIFSEKETGVIAREMEREEFRKVVSSATINMENKMKDVWLRLGISPDWKTMYRTIEDRVMRIAQLSFIKLYENGKEYRRKGPTFFCPRCSTAVSQVELEDVEQDSTFNDIAFKVDGKDVIIATTRPELLPACVAVFIHPKDRKNRHLVGKKAKVPLFDLEVSILQDERVDLEKGTGVVMCCTFGDQTDIDWYFAHNLPLRTAIDEHGKMTGLAGKYKGMNIKEARKEIIRDLKNENLLISQKLIKHDVKVHERCDTDIEFLVTEQWFIKVLDEREKWIELGNKLNWYPKYMKARYMNWVQGLQWDWCISRQRYSGIPFPVWYSKKTGEPILADIDQLPVDPLKDKPKTLPKGHTLKDIEPETDIMDTWATSALTPLINTGWNGKKTAEMYPMTWRPQGHEIISFWLFHTIVKCYYHTGKLPFKDVLINGMVLDEKAKKMSKSLGNIISPLKILDKYPVDAIRFWSMGSKTGEDIPFRDIDLINGERFMRKVWNAFNFAKPFFKPARKPEKLEMIDRWMLSNLDSSIKRITDDFETYDFYRIKSELRKLIWNLFCDNYLEIVKKRLYERKEGFESAQYTLYITLTNLLKLIAPVMPFIAEELYYTHLKKSEKEKSVHLASWPKSIKSKDKAAEYDGDILIDALSSIRKFKSESNLSMNAELKEVKIVTEKKVNQPKEIEDSLRDVMNIQKIAFSSEKLREEVREVKLNYQLAGPKFGSKVKEIVKLLSKGKYRYENGSIKIKLEGKDHTLNNEVIIKKEIDAGKYAVVEGEHSYILLNA